MRIRILGTAGVALAAAATPVAADNTDTNTVSVQGSIVAPLTIAPNANLTMPHIVRPSAGEATAQVVLTCDSTSDANNVVTYTNRSNPFAAGVSTASSQGPQSGSANRNVSGANFTGSCAQLTVSGEGSYSFIPTIGATTQPTVGGVTVAGVNCIEGGVTLTSGISRQLPAGGSTVVRCGATVQVSSTSTAAAYTDGRFTITVTYD